MAYIGDSGTGIECLLVDGVIGLVISEDGKSSLVRTMRRMGYKALPIEEYEYKAPKTVYCARDYLKIVQSPILS